MEQIESASRPSSQPITHNSPSPVRNTAISLLGPHCYSTLLHDISLTDSACVKSAISKGLGVGIIGASSIVKIPQSSKLLNSQSAQGISFSAYSLETSSYLISLAYNYRNGFPFSTYGETASIAVQNVAIAVLVSRYSGRAPAAASFVAGLAAAGYAMFSEGTSDMTTMGYLQAGAGALGVASKVPQIVQVWREGGTGQLSAFAVFNYLLGSLSRIFTTLQEVDDKSISYGFVAGFVLNAVLALQMVYYWNSPASKKTPEHKLTQSGKEEAIAMSSGADATASGRKSPSTRRRG